MSISKATKDLYKNALLALSKTQPFTKITLKSIIDYSATAKQTFYNYFEDKYDLINYVMWDFVEDIEKTYAMHSYKGIISVLDYCTENSKFFMAVANDKCQNNFSEFFLNWCVKYYVDTIQSKYGGQVPDSLLLTIQFYCHGAVGIFIDWILGGMEKPKELIAETIVSSRPQLLSEYFPIQKSI